MHKLNFIKIQLIAIFVLLNFNSKSMENSNNGVRVPLAVTVNRDSLCNSCLEEQEENFFDPTRPVGLKDYIGELPDEIKAVIFNIKKMDELAGMDPNINNRILLHGKNGTGKSMLAKIIASETGRVLFEKASFSYVTKYRGSGSKNVRRLFDMAKNCDKSCIIFIDWADGLSYKTIHEANIEYVQACRTFIEKLDESKNNPKLFVILVTDRLDLMHNSVIEQCHLIKIDLPDYEHRLKFLEFHLKDMEGFEVKLDKRTLETLAQGCENFSYSELDNIVEFAVDINFREKSTKMIIDSSVLLKSLKLSQVRYFENHGITNKKNSLQLSSGACFKVGSPIIVIVLACAVYYIFN